MCDTWAAESIEAATETTAAVERLLSPVLGIHGELPSGWGIIARWNGADDELGNRDWFDWVTELLAVGLVRGLVDPAELEDLAANALASFVERWQATQVLAGAR